LFFRTIRFRLTLWYALSLAVVLAASGLFWHYYLANSLRRHVDERILNVAQDVAGYLEDGRPAHSQDDCQELENFVHRHSWAGYVAIQNENGALTCASSNLGGIQLPLNKLTLQRIKQGMVSFETVQVPGLRQPVRLLTYPCRPGGTTTNLIQVAESLEPMNHTLEDLRLLLLTFSPLALLALSFGGWFLASRALAPVSRITRAAQNINARNLSEQLPVASSGDEIARLAQTFNAMLTRLDEAFRKTRQFSADASHELRTPLTILKGETEVALRWAKTPEEFHDILHSNLEEIDRMGRMIEDLLALAKSDAGEMPLDRHLFSLSDVLQHLYLQAKVLAEAGGLEVVLNLNVIEEIRLVGDELRLRQVFLNLISNAIKYTAAGGCIEIALAVEGAAAVVSVQDTGIGIAAEHLPHIFDRFYRIDKARNRQDGGTGLGLSIVKSIVEAHEGTISVESTVGVGSNFTVRLPLAGPGAVAAAS
jgi:heavy metal sensor kinase